MEWPDILRILLEALTGGSLIVTLITLRETRRKAAEEVHQLQATNADSILRTNEEYIVRPLKKEISGLRASVRSLTRAVNRAMECPHSADCPVRNELQKSNPDSDDPDPADRHPNRMSNPH